MKSKNCVKTALFSALVLTDRDTGRSSKTLEITTLLPNKTAGMICVGRKNSVDDELKDASDSLFTSLGLDKSTAVRMFLIAVIETGGIPFTIGRNADHDASIRTAIESRNAGELFYTAEESLSNMRAAMKAVAESGF